MFDNSKQKALKELLEVLSKGIDLLANDNLDKDLYEAFEKYADSTIKMVDEAYSYGYLSCFSHLNLSHSYFNQVNPIGYTQISMPNSAMSIYNTNRQLSEYKEKLRILLQKIATIAKEKISG